MKAIALVLATLMSAAAQDQNALPLLAFFPSAVPTSVSHHFSQEIRRLFISAGVVADVHRMPEVVRSSGRLGTVMVVFREDCTDFRHAHTPRPQAHLATTEKLRNTIRPIIIVHCDQVAGLLNQTPYEIGNQEASQLLGQALARVVSHELYHYLTQSLEHHRSALFSHSMNRNALVRMDIVFSKAESRIIRQAFERGPAAPLRYAD